MSMTVTSGAFLSGSSIPVKYTGDGEDVSPPLAWRDQPGGALEFAIICDDPDAPTAQPWVHWVIYKIPASVESLPEGIPPSREIQTPITALQGLNSWTSGQMVGYRGPAPPPGHGKHHYHFTVYALDARLDLAPGIDKQRLLDAMEGHVVATGELVGVYER